LLPGSGSSYREGRLGERGGGVIWLEVDSILSFSGALSASGASGGGGRTAGASGGSIYVRAKILEGEGGTMVANGSRGGGNNGDDASVDLTEGRRGLPGGGGRIALWVMRDRYVGEPTLQADTAPNTAFPGGIGTALRFAIPEPGTTIIVR